MSDGFVYQVRVEVVGANQLGAVSGQFAGIENHLHQTNSLLQTVNTNIRTIGVQSNTSFSGVQSALVGVNTAGAGANQALQQVGVNVERARGATGRFASEGVSGAGAVTDAWNQASGSIRSFVSGLGLIDKAKGALAKAMDAESFENAIKFSGGAEGVQNLEFVKQTAKDLKLPLESAMEGFKSLSSSIAGTNITSVQSKDLFTAVGKASAVMRLTADQSKVAFVTLDQMMSKGVVSAENLSGMFGEKIPALCPSLQERWA
jgi:hypothetical protein